MRVPLLDLSEQYRALAAAIRAQIDEVLSSQQFILGPKVEEFEQALAAYCGAKHAVGVSSGTDALLAIFMAMDLGRGDAVITTPFTFFATGGCLARVGATPVFVDIDPVTFNISPQAVDAYLRDCCHRDCSGELINNKGERIRALLPVHLFGLCCDMQPLLRIAGREQLPLIEDAAQAIGAEYRLSAGARRAGTMGTVGSLSFYPTKNLGAAGDAGAILCDDENFAQRLRLLRQHGMEQRYYHHSIGGNFRMDALQAAILNVKLPYLDRWSAARRTAADFYRQQFVSHGLTDKITLPPEPYRESGLTNHHIYHQFVIRTPERDALREYLGTREIGSAVYYPVPLHEQDCFRYLGYSAGDLPEAERAAREVLALPIFPEITREQQRYVVDAIAEFLQ